MLALWLYLQLHAPDVVQQVGGVISAALINNVAPHEEELDFW